MALCVYHETTEAVATCPVCKQGICGKCLEFGQLGMCGMCVEIAAARKATNEANRAARPAAPASASGKLATGEARPPGNAPVHPATRPPAPPPQAQPGSRGSGAPLTAPPRQPSRVGMCAGHPEQAAKAECANCAKKVCPYCLDLYDLCTECRQLPQCARHESMVGSARCAGCKMSFCKVCMDGTDYCDRCRTMRQASGKSVNSSKLPSGPLDPSGAPRRAPAVKSPTQGLQRTPTGALNGKSGGTGDRTGGPARTPTGGRGMTGKGQPQPAKRVPWPVYAVGGVLFLLVAWRILFGGRPTLSDEEALAALQANMKLVQQAAVAMQAHGGAYPTTSAAIMEELKSEGQNLDDLPLPLKLVVNTPATEPLTVAYTRVGESFEVRALDKEGRPLADNGRDIVLGPPPTREKPRDRTS